MKSSNDDTYLIFNSYLAKQLLLLGNPIIDLLKKHDSNNAVVFVFKKTNKFVADFNSLQK